MNNDALRNIFYRALAVFLVAVAAAVTINFIATPLYSASYDVWGMIDPFMAIGVVTVLIVNAVRKLALSRKDRDDIITREYLEVNLLFYLSLLLFTLFFWNWFYFLNDAFQENEPPAAFPIHLEMWTFIDILIPPVLGSTGFHLWHDGRRRSQRADEEADADVHDVGPGPIRQHGD